MRKFQVHFVSGDMLAETGSLADLLDQYEKQPIDNLLWSANSYKPEASFAMAHTSNSILLKYYIKEQYVKAIYCETNDPVFNDTCVEAFIAFDSKGYYNLEFNCLGTALIGYGSGKGDRVDIDKQLIGQIKTDHLINPPDDNGLIEWELTLNIPFTVFEYHDISPLNDRVCKMNFYKCGDELPEPHFLSWNNINHPHPNFHLPEFFGDVKFVP